MASIFKNIKHHIKEALLKYDFEFKNQDNITYQYYLMLNYILKNNNFSIRFGPYKDIVLESLKLDKREIILNENFFNNKTKILYLLGIYEIEVTKRFIDLIKTYNIKYFTDIGAGIGYHFIGLLNNTDIQKGYAFESDLKNAEHLRINFSKNVQKKNAVNIYNIFDHDFVGKVRNSKIDFPIKDNLIYMDIDGGEFDVINKDFCELFGQNIIFIEFHPYTKNAKNKIDNFHKIINQYFEVTSFKIKPYVEDDILYECLSYFKKDFKYNRFLITLSERNNNNEYYVLFPKK